MKRTPRTKLLLKGLYAALGFGSSITIASVFILSTTGSSGYNMDSLIGSSRTVSLAPLSIGNPIAAFRGIETVSPDTPSDALSKNNFVNVAVHQSVKARRGDTLAALLNLSLIHI